MQWTLFVIDVGDPMFVSLPAGPAPSLGSFLVVPPPITAVVLHGWLLMHCESEIAARMCVTRTFSRVMTAEIIFLIVCKTIVVFCSDIRTCTYTRTSYIHNSWSTSSVQHYLVVHLAAKVCHGSMLWMSTVILQQDKIIKRCNCIHVHVWCSSTCTCTRATNLDTDTLASVRKFSFLAYILQDSRKIRIH